MERATQERLVGATLLIVAGVILIPWLLDGSISDTDVTEQQLVLPGGSDSGNETRQIQLDVPREGSAGAPGSARSVDNRSVRDVEALEPSVSLPAPADRETSDSAGVPPARFAKPLPESAASAGSSGQPEPSPRISEPADDAGDRLTEAGATVMESAPASTTAPSETTRNPSGTSASAPVPRPPATSADKAWAVQVGSFASQENAERLAEHLRSKSYQAFVMRNVVEGRVRFRVRVGPVPQRSEAELLAAALREDRQPARVLSHP